MCRLYDISNGEISMDGHNIKDFSLNSLREKITMITQNPYLFSFSIKDNLMISNTKIDDKDIENVCKKTDIYDKICELPDKYDTNIGEDGVILSGGEKQRLAIARSILKNTSILLFDEATSSLDNLTQNKIQESIYGLDKDKTILIIAHRLSTIIKCDKIIVIDDGKVLDMGTHRDLLKRCKKYQELYKYEIEKNYNGSNI